MNIHDHYEPDAPTHEEQSHGLFIIDVPLSYHERLEHAAAHDDRRADFELWWIDTGSHIADRTTLARKAWLWSATPRMMEVGISMPLKYEADDKWMAWYCFTAAYAVCDLETELELAQIPCVCATIDTAPRDGTPILGYCPQLGQRETKMGIYRPGTVGYDMWLKGQWPLESGWEYNEPSEIRNWSPTHWMPLPPPPTTEATPTAGRANWNKKQTCGPLCSAKHHAEKCRIAAGTNHYRIK